MRRERPPYIPVRANQSPNGATTRGKTELTNEELENLMELEIMQHVLEMGFSRNVVRMALRKKVIETGQPFFSIEACIDAILLTMETETKNTIQGCEDITHQARKMALYESSAARSQSVSTSLSASSTPTDDTRPPRTVSNSSQEVVTTSLQTSSNTTNTNAPLTLISPSTSSIPPQPSNVRGEEERPSERMESDVSPQQMEIEEPSNGEPEDTTLLPSGAGQEQQSVEAVTERVTEDTPETSRERHRSNEGDQTELPSEVVPLINEADDIMEEAAKLLSPQTSISSQTSESSSSSSQESRKSEDILLKKADTTENETKYEETPKKATPHAGMYLFL